MEKLLVSSCLLGQPVRYDGKGQALMHPSLQALKNQQRIISFCPEIAGGLPTPRPAAEIKQGRVVTCNSDDVTAQFETGAQLALQLCQTHKIGFALLKESSPSCGRNTIYDGSHTSVKIAGMGLTAALLINNGIKVYSEEQLPALFLALAKR